MTFDAFKGMFTVATRDFIANVKSVKLLVLSLVVLLAMVGAAFGLSGLSPTGAGVQNNYALWAFAAYPGGNNSTTGSVVVRVTDYAGSPRGGLAVELGEPNAGSFQLRATNATDGDGWARFGGLGPGLYPVRFTVGTFTNTQGVSIGIPPPAANFTVLRGRFEVLGDGSSRDLGIQAILRGGAPLSGAAVYVNASQAGTLDAQGFLHLRLDPGFVYVNVTYAGHTDSQIVYVRAPTITSPLELGPDFVLYVVAFSLMGLFAPIVAIALSYDAIFKERQQGSLELLLVRPASLAGVAVGKFLGTFLSVGLPMVGVAVGALLGVVGVTGKTPDLGFTAAFVLGTLGLVAAYILIMQIFSTVAKNAGTAIMAAILVWLVFGLVWNLIFTLLQAALGIQGGTPAAFTLSALTLLFNPTGVYQLTLAAAFPPTLAASAGSYELPNWSGPVAFVVWIAALLVIAIVAFRKRAL